MGIKKELLKLFGSGRSNKAAKGKIAFAAEMEAVRAGKSAYKAHLQSGVSHSPLLRRNIHRLEKGLCFPDGKRTFAEKYITETVTAFSVALKADTHDPLELQWAKDVLTRYFDRVEKTAPIIADAYALFLSGHDAYTGSSSPFPFKQIKPVEGINGESFLRLCQNRVSCRWFTDRKLSRLQIEQAVKSASQAASACNRQPFQFLLIENAELKKQVVNLPFGTAGFGEDLPHLMMVLGDLSNFALERDRHLIYIDSALATAQLMLSFTAQGFASVPINWPDVEENHTAARKLLGLENYHVPIMLVGFGCPDPEAMIPFSQKKPPHSLMKVYD